MNGFRLLRHTDSSTRRLQARRRPTVEALEGRQLLSGIVGDHIGMNAADFRAGSHIGTGAMIVGNHIGTSAMVKGGHIGTSVANAAILFPVFAQ
jgi:hypothetical protein